MLVRENLNFKRGMDVKKALNLGKFFAIPMEEIKSKDIMEQFGYDFLREEIEEDANSEGDSESSDVWIKNDLEVYTYAEEDDLPYYFWAWSKLIHSIVIDLDYHGLNHAELLEEIKMLAKKEMNIDF